MLKVAVLLGLIIAIAPAAALGSYEIVEERYADPFSIDISQMSSLAEIPVDDPSDGIDWVKVPLPKPV